MGFQVRNSEFEAQLCDSLKPWPSYLTSPSPSFSIDKVGIIRIYLAELSEGLNEITHEKPSAQGLADHKHWIIGDYF